MYYCVYIYIYTNIYTYILYNMIHLSKPNHQWIGSVYSLSSAVSNGTSGPVLGQAFSPLVFHQDPSGTGSPKDLGGAESVLEQKIMRFGMTCLYFGLFWINRNDRWKLISGVRYPHLLSSISPNFTNDRNSLILSMFVASCYSRFISAISWLTMYNHSACQWIGWYDFPIRGDHTSCWGTDFLFWHQELPDYPPMDLEILHMMN